MSADGEKLFEEWLPCLDSLERATRRAIHNLHRAKGTCKHSL